MNYLQARRRLERLWLWLFPRRCIWCRNVTEPRRMFCVACQREAAAHLQPTRTLPRTQIPLVSLLPYHSKGKGMLYRFKFRGDRSLAHSIGYAMGEQLAGTLDKPEAWLFCAVPMTKTQIKKRGYNQSALLAQTAARWVAAPCDLTLLRKCRETDVQHRLPAFQREANVNGAFEAAASGSIAGKRIVLCDDICTTGATLKDCCRALQEAGAAEIICLTFLRTLGNK